MSNKVTFVITKEELDQQLETSSMVIFLKVSAVLGIRIHEADLENCHWEPVTTLFLCSD